MMNISACCEFCFDWFWVFLCLQGRRQWQSWFFSMLPVPFLSLCEFMFFHSVFLHFLPLFMLGFSSSCSLLSAPFYRARASPVNQSHLCRTVIQITNGIMGKRRAPRSDRICCRSSACWTGMEKATTAVPSNGDVSGKMGIFNLTPELCKFHNWTPKQIKISFNFSLLMDKFQLNP